MTGPGTGKRTRYEKYRKMTHIMFNAVNMNHHDPPGTNPLSYQGLACRVVLPR